MSGHLLKKIQTILPPSIMRHIINTYKPFRGARIKMTYLSKDYRQVIIKMPLKWNNKNYFGTQYGGSLFSMTDSFYAIMLASNLGRNYIIWDIEANIKFIKPGYSEVRAEFNLSIDELNEIKLATQNGDKFIFEKLVEVIDKQNEIIALVNKKIYIRKKRD